jgi:toxin ParE1/3/4
VAGGWVVRLTAAAEADCAAILRWPAGQFGEAQARISARTVAAALTDLAAGPTVTGMTRRDDIVQGLCTLHVARSGCKGSHFAMFSVVRAPDQELIEVLHILQDAMDLPRHLPPNAANHGDSR